jgi:hypothetical protein
LALTAIRGTTSGEPRIDVGAAPTHQRSNVHGGRHLFRVSQSEDVTGATVKQLGHGMHVKQGDGSQFGRHNFGGHGGSSEVGR